MDIQIEPQMQKEIGAISEKALALQVIDAESYALAGEILKAHKDMEKHIKTYFEPLKKTAHASWKALCDRENEELNKLKPASQHLNKTMTDWYAEEERKRKAEEARLLDEAKKREEEERLAAAIELEKEGLKEEAKALIDEPVFVPPPIIQKVQPKIAGLSVRTTWEAVVTDKMALIKGVASGAIPQEAIEPNMAFLNNQARALKESLKYAGVIARENKSMGGVRK